MAATRISNIESRAVAWGNGLGLRITKPLAEAAGIDLNTVLSASARPGRILIEVLSGRPSLDALPAAFDPKRHGGEAMALRPIGREIP